MSEKIDPNKAPNEADKPKEDNVVEASAENLLLKYEPSDRNVHRMPIKERPSQLKLARGPPVKIKVNTMRILASIQEKMTLRKEVSKFGRLNSSVSRVPTSKPISGVSKSSILSKSSDGGSKASILRSSSGRSPRVDSQVKSKSNSTRSCPKSTSSALGCPSSKVHPSVLSQPTKSNLSEPIRSKSQSKVSFIQDEVENSDLLT